MVVLGAALQEAAELQRPTAGQQHLCVHADLVCSITGRAKPMDMQSNGLTSQEVRAQYQCQAQEDHSRDFSGMLSYNCGQEPALSFQHGQMDQEQHTVYMHISPQNGGTAHSSKERSQWSLEAHKRTQLWPPLPLSVGSLSLTISAAQQQRARPGTSAAPSSAAVPVVVTTLVTCKCFYITLVCCSVQAHCLA